MRVVILQYVQLCRVVSHYSTFYKLVRASTDGKSLGKLKMTLAALQCSLSSESKSSERFVPPHTEIPYVTAGIITGTRLCLDCEQPLFC